VEPETTQKNGVTQKFLISRKDKRSNMKKILALIFFASVTTVTFAQSNSKSEDKKREKISYVVKGGLNLSNLLVKDNETTYSKDFKSKPGFHVGLTTEIPISGKFTFESGILLSTNGFKNSVTETIGNETFEHNDSYNLLYIDIPLTGKAYFNVGQTKIFGALGPYIGLGLSGKVKAELITNGQTEPHNQDINWGTNSDDDLRRPDFGMTVAVGAEISSIQFGLYYNLGLANISATTDNGYKIKNKVLGLTVGYKFGGN
jgi:hypothetical protein